MEKGIFYLGKEVTWTRSPFAPRAPRTTARSSFTVTSFSRWSKACGSGANSRTCFSTFATCDWAFWPWSPFQISFNRFTVSFYRMFLKLIVDLLILRYVRRYFWCWWRAAQIDSTIDFGMEKIIGIFTTHFFFTSRYFVDDWLK